MSALANFLVLADCRVGRLSVGGLSFGGLSFGELSYLLDCRVGGLSEYEKNVVWVTIVMVNDIDSSYQNYNCRMYRYIDPRIKK
jgi:hypothetical protein